MAGTHELKVWPQYFAAIIRGDKRFEVRNTDRRDFQTGDTLRLREWDPLLVRVSPPWPPGSRPADAPEDCDGYTGRECNVDVTWILHGGAFGLERNTVVMAITTPELVVELGA